MLKKAGALNFKKNQKNCNEHCYANARLKSAIQIIVLFFNNNII